MTIGTVTPDMVSRFEVSVCIEADPCQHDCKIVLSDERERNASIDRVDIDSLIQAIARYCMKLHRTMTPCMIILTRCIAILVSGLFEIND